MIRVLKAGLWTSIQDRGRFTYKHLGVPSAGCMDQVSADLANLLLNNPIHAAVLEMTMMGPALEFQSSSHIVVCGADISAKINQQPISVNCVYKIQEGDVLSFAHLNYGARAYLAVKGGFQTENELGSRSYYQGITRQAKLEKGDLLDILPLPNRDFQKHALVKVNKTHFSNDCMSCFAGPEYALLNATQKSILEKQYFTLSSLQTRMGFQLTETIRNNLNPILSSAVMPGTIQLTPSGKLIVLMRDSHTTGGYPRILQLNESSINQLSQKRPNDKIIFKLKNTL